MVRLMKDLLAQSARETFVGRTEELRALSELLDNGPRLVFVHGIAGVGKSALSSVFADRARALGAAVIELDCRAIEPTERGFLIGLRTAVGGRISRLGQATARLESLGDRVLLMLDNYEVFRLMDTWLRQAFVPLLPENVRVLIVGRDTPAHSWITTPGWQGLVRTIPLGSLSESESIKLLVDSGTAESEARLINRLASGHPLALKLAASVTMNTYGTSGMPGLGFQRVFEQLMTLYLDDVHDPMTRRALDAASVVRRITVSLLQVMLPEAAPQDVFARLQNLPFVENEQDGLRLHDLVQQSIANSLQATDPNRYQEYRRAAWQQLSSEARRTGSPGLWRYTADILYMIANPAVREAFFPSGLQHFSVEPAQVADGPAILKITKLHEPREAADLIDMWWRKHPQAFHAVRDQNDEVAGFYLMFDPSTIDPALLKQDCIVAQWWKHLGDEPVPDKQCTLFLRRWLSRDDGEKPSSVQAACWLDIKRTYMEMRPQLRRVYLTLRDLTPYGPVAQRLGFQQLEGETQLGGNVYTSAMLDLGPSSVDGWLASLAAAELGMQEEVLDAQAHELVLDGERVKLTKLEFELFQYLYDRKGMVVSRASLVEDVWGWKHTGSNVVEAVVRTLRKKLDNRSSAIETIRGTGYRFRQFQHSD